MLDGTYRWALAADDVFTITMDAGQWKLKHGDSGGEVEGGGTFTVDGDMVYTAVDQKPKSGRPLKRLRNVGENPVVTMLADHYSEDWETLWWVRADGRAAILTGLREMAAPLRLLTDRYWQYREAPPTGPVLAVTVERWTGWSGARAG